MTVRRVMPSRKQSGTAAEVTPIGSIGPWTFEVGDLTRQLARDYDDLVYGRLPNA
jgi:branched-chain amino acid aminotransferase